MAKRHGLGVVAAYVAGGVTGPLLAAVLKPRVRTAVKATIVLAFRVKKMVAEAAEDLEDLAAEAVADAQAESNGSASASPSPRPRKADSSGASAPKE